LTTDTLTLVNAGPLDTTSTVVATTLPSGVSFVAGSSSGNCSASGQTVSCAVGNLAVNATTTVVVAAQAPATQLTLALTFTAKSAQADSNPANNSVTVTTQNPSLVDLALTGSGSKTTDGLATDTLTLTNNGPAGATSVRVKTTLPSGASFVAASSSSNCTVSAQDVTCNLSGVAANASKTVTVASQASDHTASLPLTFVASAARMDESIASLGLNVAHAKEKFEKAFITTPQKAAAVILRGVRRNQRRVLIGADARAIDAAVRLMPSAYQRLTVALARRSM
jgi:uncharacterized repeat protein (TIGR01451 family)